VKILFTLLGEVGHVNPFVGIARALVANGHEVAVHSTRSFESQFARAGVRARWYRDGVADAPVASPQQMAARMRNLRWLRGWYELALRTLPASVQTIRSTVRDFRPDVICVDPLIAAGAIVAESEKIPWAAVTPVLSTLRPTDWSCPFLDVAVSLAPRMRELLDAQGAHGIVFEGVDVVSPSFNSVFTTEAFAPRAQTANTHSTYVGPARSGGPRGDEPEFPWERLHERPLVYVASGGGQSLSFDPASVLRIARAIPESAASIVLAVHHLVDDAGFMSAVPPHCIVTRYAPQLRLLDRAAVAVTHGGINTVNECLERGCPMIVMPLGKEQPLQAELVRRAGAGTTLDPMSFTDEECRDSVLAMIADGPYRERARIIRDSYRATDSSAVVCAALERLA
jgi:MGT family glycosyltransferase